MAYYLCIGSDDLSEASRHHRLRDAVDAFREVAEEHTRYGNTPPGGTIHIAAKRSECVDDADYYLSVGPRGGVRCERV